ncbi:MAG: hypothetical protein QMD50_02545 [Patescibacteria group bacterium]|nr:hypothetical protein [Patescibacteria group bacterium]
MEKQTKEPFSGKFIVFEGIGGSGKSTMCKKLHDFLVQKNVPTLLNTEPTKNNVFGITIRKIIEGDRLSRKFIHEKFGPEVMVFSAVMGMETIFLSQAKRSAAIDFGRKINGVLGKIIDNEELTELDRQIIFMADRYFDLKDTIRPALTRGKWVIQDRFDWSSAAYGAGSDLTLTPREIFTWQDKGLENVLIKPDLVFFIDLAPKKAVDRLVKSGKVIDRYESLKSLNKINRAYTDAFVSKKAKSLLTGINGDCSEEEVFAQIVEQLRIHFPHDAKKYGFYRII